MNPVVLFTLSFCFALAVGLACPAKAEATELDSIYVSVRISPEQYRKWQESPMKHMDEYDDWDQMTDQWDESWKDEYYRWDYKTMGEMTAMNESPAPKTAPVSDSAPAVNSADWQQGVDDSVAMIEAWAQSSLQQFHKKIFSDPTLDKESADKAFASYKETMEKVTEDARIRAEQMRKLDLSAHTPNAPADEDPFLYGSYPHIEYNEQEGVFTYAQLLYDENFINCMLDLSAYRTLADFKDTEGPDFLVIYPFIWNPGYTVIMEVGKGYTKFHHNEETVPASFQKFMERANAHFGKELAELEKNGQ